jgi:NAD(P)-dependent dehydrogenase (short-subunit alcohol dehydrogenase family)
MSRAETGTGTGGRGAALVTGAAKGIGLATARALAQGGYRVAALDSDAAALAAADLPAGAVRIHHDVADTAVDVTSLLGDAGPVGVLVNNVGVMDGRSFLELPAADAARTLLANVVGTWAVSRTVAGQMIAGGVRGSIVFNLSLHASRVRMCPDYSASKAALLMLMREMAVELGPHGIRVNAVSPRCGRHRIRRRRGRRRPPGAQRRAGAAAPGRGARRRRPGRRLAVLGGRRVRHRRRHPRRRRPAPLQLAAPPVRRRGGGAGRHPPRRHRARGLSG